MVLFLFQRLALIFLVNDNCTKFTQKYNSTEHFMRQYLEQAAQDWSAIGLGMAVMVDLVVVVVSIAVVPAPASMVMTAMMVLVEFSRGPLQLLYGTEA